MCSGLFSNEVYAIDLNKELNFEATVMGTARV